MPVVQFHCPHCGGLFQIDESLSGQHVSCPLCTSVVAIPELTPSAGEQPPPPPSGFEPSPADSEETFQLGCPICEGIFQVTRDMGGQQVACPHCNNPVLLPEFESPHAPAPPSAEWERQREFSPPPYDSPQSASPWEAAPHDVAPPDATPASSDEPPAPSSPSFVSTSPVPSPSVGRTDEPRAPEESKDRKRMDSPDELLPPDVSARREAKTHAAKSKPKETAKESADSLLPPGAKSKRGEDVEKPSSATRASQADELLPPGAAPKKTSAVKERAKSKADDLLPPTAEKEHEGKSKKPEEARDDSEAHGPLRPGVAADGSILMPTEEGGYVALREPVKTITKKGREIELHRLSPEEKARRRFRRNLFVAGFGMIFLIAMMLVMAYLNGAL